MQQLVAKVVAKQDLTKDIFRMTIYAPAVAKEARPGQFVHLQCGEDQSYILRRPFSVHQVTGTDAVEVLVKVIGQGTRWLAQRRPKDSINMIGPLGNGFNMPDGLSRALIVAGGMGVAPLVFLAHKLAAQKVKVYTLMGAASRMELLDFMDLKRLTRRISVSTEDGSQGHRGLITDILSREIEDVGPEIIYSCGPEAMLRNVAGIARRHGVACQVSLEARMACGVGACLGCAVKGRDGYVNVCSDGPVFDLEALEWGVG